MSFIEQLYMSRIICLDYGRKKIGLAATDPLQIIVSGLDTIPRNQIEEFLKNYLEEEEVEKIVLGDPGRLNEQTATLQNEIVNFSKKLSKLFPAIPVVLHDEKFSSAEAKKIILASGAKKKKRRDKALIDKVSAVLILQDYLDHK